MAFGVANMQSAGRFKAPRPLTLARSALGIGDTVTVFGYSDTVAPTDANPREYLAFWPRDHHGHVIASRSSVSHGYRGWREYVVDAETCGGCSGAPLASRDSLHVHGVVSTGIGEACGFAVDVREFVDSWPIAALGDMTIGAFSARNPSLLRVVA